MSLSTLSDGSSDLTSSDLTSYYCIDCDTRHDLGSDATPYVCDSNRNFGNVDANHDYPITRAIRHGTDRITASVAIGYDPYINTCVAIGRDAYITACIAIGYDVLIGTNDFIGCNIFINTYIAISRDVLIIAIVTFNHGVLLDVHVICANLGAF